MLILPERVHFGLGFGFKYQALITMLLNILLKTHYFKKNKITASHKLHIKNVLLKENNFADSNKFIQSLEELVKIHNINLVNSKKNIIMIEGEHHYLEDINVFFKNGYSDSIFFYQVKGNSQFYKSGKENSSSVNSTVIKAINNLLVNKNIQKNKNIKFLILTNRDVANHFFLKNPKDKELVVLSIISSLTMVKKIQEKVANINLTDLLIEVMKELVLNNKVITRFSLIRLFLEKGKIKLSNKDKKTMKTKRNKQIICKLISNDLIFKLENFRYVIQNLKIISYLDHRLIYLFLRNFYSNYSILNYKLSEIEFKAIDATPVSNALLSNELRSLGFTFNNIVNFKFSEDKNKFSIGKICDK